jgi:NAD(P)-dependent dehydrogenase (short-subunit alcohol dehydrogenase family)
MPSRQDGPPGGEVRWRDSLGGVETGCVGKRGIGRAIARRFAEEGADLVLTELARDGTRVVASKAECGWGAAWRQSPRGACDWASGHHTALSDIRASDQIDRVLAQMLEGFGQLDVRINNAAAPPGQDRVQVVDLLEEAWEAVLDTNLKGRFLCAKAATILMQRRRIRGWLINIASVDGKVGRQHLAAYCSSKFGLIGFTQSLAMELAPAGIMVNAMAACQGRRTLRQPPPS